MHQAAPTFITAGTAKSASASNDEVVLLLTERAAELRAFEEGPGDDDCEHFARCTEIDEELTDARPTTPAGAIASLEFLRSQLIEFVLSSRDDNESRLFLSLIDGPIGVLRKQS